MGWLSCVSVRTYRWQSLLVKLSNVTKLGNVAKMNNAEKLSNGAKLSPRECRWFQAQRARTYSAASQGTVCPEVSLNEGPEVAQSREGRIERGKQRKHIGLGAQAERILLAFC